MIHARPDYNRIQDPRGKIPTKEPVFLLRAQDRIAATVVRIWAILNFITMGSRHASALAFGHAKRMGSWGKKKACDVPHGAKNNFSEYEGDTTAQLYRLADSCSDILLGGEHGWEDMEFDEFVMEVRLALVENLRIKKLLIAEGKLVQTPSGLIAASEYSNVLRRRAVHDLGEPVFEEESDGYRGG